MKIKDKFKQLRKQGKKAFIAYVPFGFPSIKASKDICLALEAGGADIIELGLPFSDPLADGPIIQKATTTAIEKGADIRNFLKELALLNKLIKIPVVVMSYYNPIFKFGTDRFLEEIKQKGAAGTILVDLPLEESKGYIKKARVLGLDTIFFITPVTSPKRSKEITKSCRGFIYYISVTGITGPKDLNYSSLSSHIKSIKKTVGLPVCVGFGIHSREQVVKIDKISDGAIVGSDIVKFIDKHHRDKGFLNKLESHAKYLSGK